jgi:hypothetical protein
MTDEDEYVKCLIKCLRLFDQEMKERRNFDREYARQKK